MRTRSATTHFLYWTAGNKRVIFYCYIHTAGKRVWSGLPYFLLLKFGNVKWNTTNAWFANRSWTCFRLGANRKLHSVYGPAALEAHRGSELRDPHRGLHQGGLAQMVERSLGVRGVAGSMPAFSTCCASLLNPLCVFLRSSVRIKMNPFWGAFT